MDDLPINERIEKRLAYADYLLNKTYPLVKEVKLFLEIINHLEAASRDLSEVQENEIFSAQGIKDSSVPKLSEKSSEFQEVFTSLKELKYAKDNDLFSFKRGESYVICKNNYKVQVLSVDLLQNYLNTLATTKQSLGK